jgi:hypothetical protein
MRKFMFAALAAMALPFPLSTAQAQTRDLASLIADNYEMKAMSVMGQAGFWLQKQNTGIFLL